MADYDLMTGVKKAYEAYSPTNKPTTADVTGLDEALKNAGGNPVLSTAWVQLRTAMWNGYVAADGQTLPSAAYPDAFAAIQAGLVPVCTDAEWLADPAKRGCFTLGDGSTTFRVPDYNGMQPGSYGPVYLGGGSAASGAILRDQIQNITGELNGIYGESAMAAGNSKGAFAPKASTIGRFKYGFNTAWEEGSTLASFDASRVARTGDTTRPITAEGCLAIKLFGAVQNAGSIDAMGLATQVANLDSNKLDKANVVSPMANGGVIERGSNANGEFVKFADGTMICTTSNKAVPPITKTVGSIFTILDTMGPYSWPVNFVGEVRGHVNCSSDAITYQGQSIPVTTSIYVATNITYARLSAPVSIQDIPAGFVAAATAIGRWK